MKFRTVLPLALALLLLPLLSPLQATIIDSCVAVVNEDVITLSEVNEAGKAVFQRVAEQVPPSQLADTLKEARKTVIEQLIEKKLLLQHAKLVGVTVSAEDVKRAQMRLLERNNTSMEQFQAELDRMNMKEEQYLENLHDQILSSKLVNYEVRSKIVIPEEKILDYYDNHYTEQVEAGGYYILQIGFTFEGKAEDIEKSKEIAEQQAARVHSIAVGGKDFKELAREYSDLPSGVDGGDLGSFQEDEMAPYMRDAVTSLKPGEISQVVTGPDSYMFFKLMSSQEGAIVTKVPYESVKEEIHNTLYQQQMEERFTTWFDEIKNQAYIKIL